MKFSLLLLCLQFLSLSGIHSQSKCRIIIDLDWNTVQLKGMFKGKGKIFQPGETDFLLSENSQPETLCIRNIILAEKLIAAPSDQMFEVLSGVRKNRRLERYYRQYLGFVNNRGEKIVLIHFFNFKGQGKKIMDDWKSNFSFGAGDWSEENTVLLAINISKKTARFP